MSSLGSKSGGAAYASRGESGTEGESSRAPMSARAICSTRPIPAVIARAEMKRAIRDDPLCCPGKAA